MRVVKLSMCFNTSYKLELPPSLCLVKMETLIIKIKDVKVTPELINQISEVIGYDKIVEIETTDV